MSDCSTCGGCGNKKKGSVDTESIIKVLTGALEHKMKFNQGHGERIAMMSKWFAEYLGIDSQMCELVGLAGYLHDIGMLSLPDGILNKTGPLSEQEWIEIRNHPDNAFRYLEAYEDLREVQLIVRDHHEHFDGGGYPGGLEGEEIHLGARIIALCESIDTMATKQPYSEAKSREAIAEEVGSQSGKQFDPWLCMHINELLTVAGEMFEYERF